MVALKPVLLVDKTSPATQRSELIQGLTFTEIGAEGRENISAPARINKYSESLISESDLGIVADIGRVIQCKSSRSSRCKLLMRGQDSVFRNTESKMVSSNNLA